MTKKDLNKTEEQKFENIAGETFEDLSIAEMAEIQGAGDTEAEATPAVTASIISVLKSAQLSMNLARSLKGKC